MSQLSDFENMRAALFFLAPRSNYRDKILSSKEIFCGPDAETQLGEGSLKSLKTPAGAYDAPAFFSQSGITEMPELVLVKADATGRNFPSNLRSFKCPRVLLVGDTHHQSSPIQQIVAYAQREAFDFIILDHTRHHARWFFEAGFKNVHWLPALDFSYLPRDLKKSPAHKLTFVGQAGRFHPHRVRVLENLKKAGLPLEVLQSSPSGAADLYADSEITLNISLNGDLNLRVFEALSAGGFLLTDKLTASSGLERLFKPGEDLDVWSNTSELIEKIRYYQKHPAKIERIRKAGQAKLVKFHHPEIKIREFFDLVFHGKENPLYSLEEEAKKTTVSFARPMPGVGAYELLQELHRGSSLVVYADESLVGDVGAFVDLPRAQALAIGSTAGARFPVPKKFEPPAEMLLWLVGNKETPEELLQEFNGRAVLAPDRLADLLKTWGFLAIGHGVYEMRKPVLRLLRRLDRLEPQKAVEAIQQHLPLCSDAGEALALATHAARLQAPGIHRSALELAVALDRNCLPALLGLAEVSLKAGESVQAAIHLNEADRIEPLEPGNKATRDSLFQKCAGEPVLQLYRQALAGGQTLTTSKKLSILVVTNLFPPQELGGYGRKLWEFSADLRQRGHRVHVLTANADYLNKTPDPAEIELESVVSRCIELQGEWKNGVTRGVGTDQDRLAMAQRNAAKVLQAAQQMKADIVLLGNLDFMGLDMVHALLQHKIPVLHSLGNQTPGYPPAASIQSPLYQVAPASDWLGKNLLEAGYSVYKLSTVYPGARIDRFYKHTLPDLRKLRIAFAGLLMPYKGAHILIDALAQIHRAGIDFEAVLAGDTTDPSYVERLKQIIVANGMGGKIHFPGFLSRKELAALFARTNVLVFPSQVPEAFGISQVEAMASGLIVVSSGTGGAPEIIRDGIDGLLFPATNPTALAECLHKLATQPELRLRLQRAARNRASEFSVTSSVNRIEAIASEMLGLAAPAALAPSANAPLAVPQPAVVMGNAAAPTAAAQLQAQAERLLQQGQHEAALAVYQQAIVPLKKDYAGGIHQYGLALQKLGRAKDALAKLNEAYLLDPQSLPILSDLAVCFDLVGQPNDALAAFDAALQLNPQLGLTWNRKGKILARLQRYPEAFGCLSEAIKFAPDNKDFFYDIGLAYQVAKKPAEALHFYDQALAMKLDTADLHSNRGIVLRELHRHQDALASIFRAVNMDKQNVHYMTNLGAVALEMGHNTLAYDCLKYAIDRDSNMPIAEHNLANLIKDRARAAEALPLYRKAIELFPKNSTLRRQALSNYLLGHQYLPNPDPAEIFEEHKKWGLETIELLPPAYQHTLRNPGANGKIRVGFVSADFWDHPVATFMEPFFREFDRSKFEVFIYSDLQRSPTAVTQRLRGFATAWRDTVTLDIHALAKMMHEDSLDVLFDLAGHTAHNRMDLFALKPAPVQISYLGYPCTTGLPTIEYRITDAVADPVGKTEHLHSEKLVYLPDCAWCFEAPEGAPGVAPLPAIQSGHITFGCFNNMAKWNTDLYEMWIAILNEVPDSRLRLKARTLLDAPVRTELVEFFKSKGIEEARLEFSGHTPSIAQHLAEYNKVDIALDSYPYHGTTTTCEAMWMGVPVVTLCGNFHLARVGASLLAAVGLSELVADSRENYVQVSAKFASDREKLAQLRAGFRERMLASPLMNAKAFAQNMGNLIESAVKK
jgi:predicted O-linked N-acetylglucosamine transferase (SPINDLY family)